MRAQACLTLCDPWTVAARLVCPWGFFRQERTGGLPLPPQGGLPDPGIRPTPRAPPALAGGPFPPLLPRESSAGAPPGPFTRQQVSLRPTAAGPSYESSQSR